MKAFIKGWELRKGIDDAAHKIASALRLGKIVIRWDSDVSTACISAKGVIILADIADDAVVNYKVFLKYLGFIIHELLHRKYTTFGIDYPNRYVAQLANALEDARIEHKAIAANLTGNVAPLLSALIDHMTAEALAEVTDWNDARQLPFVLAVFARDHATVKVPVHPAIKPIFIEARKRLNTCDNSHDVANLAIWVYEQLKSAIEDQPEDGEGDNPTDDEPTDGEGDAPTDGEGEGEGDGEAGDGESDGDGESGTGGKDGKPSGRISEINPDDAVETEPKLDREDGVGNGISWSPDRSITKDCAHVDDAIRWNINPVGGAKLRYEVKRLFENSGIDEFQFNRKQGQLDTRSLHTVAAGNDRVFKRHHEEGGIDSAVVFVMDCSGSMFGMDSLRMKAAAPVLATMLDTLDRAGVATSVVTFGTRVSMLKPWGMAKAKALDLIQRLCTGSDNSDSTALRYAHNLLLNRSEQRKVVFIIADGGVDRDDEKRCMAQAKSGERLGITTIGIGIHADLSRMYPNNVSISSLDDLANASFKQIKLAA
jgi:cobalamin biosynthesis protein CobT